MTTVLIGASRLEQIEENVKSLEAPPLSSSELERIDRILTPDVFASAKKLNLWVDY
jgi:aryl-alcohol dehydrogenase-like predicted oxidoreductase